MTDSQSAESKESTKAKKYKNPRQDPREFEEMTFKEMFFDAKYNFKFFGLFLIFVLAGNLIFRDNLDWQNEWALYCPLIAFISSAGTRWLLGERYTTGIRILIVISVVVLIQAFLLLVVFQ